MEAEEFKKRLYSFISFQSDKNQTFLSDEFLNFCEQFLIFRKEISNLKRCYFEGITCERRKMQIHAYDIDKSIGSCSLFFCRYEGIYNEYQDVEKDVKESFKKMLAFVEESAKLDLHGCAFYKRLEETAPVYEISKYIYDNLNSIKNFRFYIFSDVDCHNWQQEDLPASVEGKNIQYIFYDTAKLFECGGSQVLNHLADTVNFSEGLQKYLQHQHYTNSFKLDDFYCDPLFTIVQSYRLRCCSLDDVFRVLLDKCGNGGKVFVGLDFYNLFSISRKEIIKKIFKCPEVEIERCLKSSIREYQLLHRDDGEYGFWIDIFTSPEDNENISLPWLEAVSFKKTLNIMVTIPECLGILINPYTDRLPFSKDCFDKFIFEDVEKGYGGMDELFEETSNLSEQTKIYNEIKTMENKYYKLRDRMLSASIIDKRKYQEEIKKIKRDIENLKKKLEGLR